MSATASLIMLEKQQMVSLITSGECIEQHQLHFYIQYSQPYFGFISEMLLLFFARVSTNQD